MGRDFKKLVSFINLLILFLQCTIEGVKLIETRISSRGAFGRHQCQDNKHAIRGKKHVNRKGRGLSSGEFLDLEFSYMSPSKLGREEWLWAQTKDNIYSIVTF